MVALLASCNLFLPIWNDFLFMLVGILGLLFLPYPGLSSYIVDCSKSKIIVIGWMDGLDGFIKGFAQKVSIIKGGGV